jgi:hypothetical protein
MRKMRSKKKMEPSKTKSMCKYPTLYYILFCLFIKDTINNMISEINLTKNDNYTKKIRTYILNIHF